MVAMDDSYGESTPIEIASASNERSPVEQQPLTPTPAAAPLVQSNGLEASLTRQIEHLTDQLAAEQPASADLGRLRWERQLLEKRERALDESEVVLRLNASAAGAARTAEECAAERTQLAQIRQRVSEQQLKLEAERERIQSDRAKTRRQRRRIAREFRAQREEHFKELEQRRKELASSPDAQNQGLDQKLLRKQSAQLRDVLRSRVAEVKQLRAQVAELIHERETLRHDLDASRTDHDRLSQDLAIYGAGGGRENGHRAASSRKSASNSRTL